MEYHIGSQRIVARPFNWSLKSFDRLVAKSEGHPTVDWDVSKIPHSSHYWEVPERVELTSVVGSRNLPYLLSSEFSGKHPALAWPTLIPSRKAAPDVLST